MQTVPEAPMPVAEPVPATEITVDINGPASVADPMAAAVPSLDPMPASEPVAAVAEPLPAFPMTPTPAMDPGLAPQPPTEPLPMLNPDVPPAAPVATGPVMPGQPMPGPLVPGQPPMGAQPPFTPMAASQMPKSGGKKKLRIIIGGAVGVLLVLVIIFVVVFSKAALVGKLGSDSFEGLNYKSPVSWTKDTSKKDIVSYHPKKSLGKNSSGSSTYALEMGVSAKKDIFGSIPNDLSASEKAQLQSIIDKEIDSAAQDIMPSKSDIGCSTDPVYKDKPVKIDVKDTFLAVKYSFTCKNGFGSSATTSYYSFVDIVPNDKDVEYLLHVGAASESVYTTNLDKINEIINSVSI
jgi:hypothetical protein